MPYLSLRVACLQVVCHISLCLSTCLSPSLVMGLSATGDNTHALAAPAVAGAAASARDAALAVVA